jgi:hypothetical protein
VRAVEKGLWWGERLKKDYGGKRGVRVNENAKGVG